MIAKTTTKGTGTFVVVLGKRTSTRRKKAGHLPQEMTRLSNQPAATVAAAGLKHVPD